MATPIAPDAMMLAAALAKASELFIAKADRESKIAALQAELVDIDTQIKAAVVTIQPLADSVTAYANSL